MPPPEDAVRDDDLQLLIERQLTALGHRDDPDVVRLADAICSRHGNRTAAVLLYGSYLRGKRDTLLDFYVLLTTLDGAMPGSQALGNRWLPPNVYHLPLPADAGRPAVRAKYATLTLEQFESAMGDFHSYFWARFTQPTGLVRAGDPDAARRVAAAMATAVDRFSTEVAPMLPTRERGFGAAEFWQRGLALTYGCELRSEDPAGVISVYQHNASHLDALLAAYAARQDGAIVREDGSRYRIGARVGGGWPRLRWGVRRVQGKVLSVLRLVKAAVTFDDPLDYLLWKIERHSGIYIEPSERQRRYPLIFAWGLLWRLYRRGAFR